MTPKFLKLTAFLLVLTGTASSCNPDALPIVLMNTPKISLLQNIL